MSERRGTKGLELWCKKMTEGYPGVKVENMTTSWRDGLAFCAIIHHFRPDLIDFSKLNKDDVYHNNELAFRVAEHHLGIPALLEPEDMVEYDVPDRLSILTYLSQFYQAFAATQGASKRIPSKRPQTSPEHDIGSPTSSSPPSKVASVSVGKIRRDPCAKCRLPVFLAERLNIGKLLFHRTCFRCARCSSQLTLASYYETENGEFCCEVCPDEEKLMAKTSHEKIVLQKSLSDEEKTANLRMITGQSDDYSELFETALESVTSGEKTPSEFSEARSNFFLSQIAADTPDQEEKPPLLPKTDPPELEKIDRPPKDLLIDSARNDSGFPNTRLSEVYSNSKISVEKIIPNSTLELSHNIVTKDKQTEDGGNISLVKARARLFETNIDSISKSDVHKNSTKDINKVPTTPNKSTIPIVKLDDLENFDNFSKKTVYNETDDKKIDTFTTTIVDNVSNKDEIGDTNIVKKAEATETHEVVAQKEVDILKKPDVTRKSRKEEEPDIVVSHKIKTQISSFTDHTEITQEDSETQIFETVTEIERKPSPEIIDLTKTSHKIKNQMSLFTDDTEITQEDSEPQTFNTVTEIERKPSPEIIDLTKTSSVDISIHSSPEKENSDSKEGIPIIEISDESGEVIDSAQQSSEVIVEEEYPDDLNPFDDEDAGYKPETENKSLNPFGSDDEDKEKDQVPTVRPKPLPTPRMRKKIVPNSADRDLPGTPVTIERVSINPFDSPDEYADGTPPVPAARKKKLHAPKVSLNPFWSEDEENEEEIMPQPVPKPRTSIGSTPEPKQREFNSLNWSARHTFGSTSSISSGSAPGSARKKKPAPRPPIPNFKDDYGPSSLNYSPSHSVTHSPRLTPKYRKNRIAPPPPQMKTSTPLEENRRKQISTESLSSVILDSGPKSMETAETEFYSAGGDTEKEKTVKDEENRSIQTNDNYLQSPSSSESSSIVPAPNKSTYGQWKRRKGQAPKRPIPQRRVIKVLPMSEIRRELDLIEVQQQGLERQGVKIEQIIREKCEGKPEADAESPDGDTPIDVEDLILQLFEIVNEKNELFRKQTELMYLKRQQRLEEEHADVEYQIRCLMLKPEENKTDSDKTREEELIKRLVDIVERRNEIIECLENDRVRETEEDNCINNHITLYTLKRDGGDKADVERSTKDRKKEKKDKHHKKEKSKHKDKKKTDSDKDVDESESSLTKEKKKKKKFNLF